MVHREGGKGEKNFSWDVPPAQEKVEYQVAKPQTHQIGNNLQKQRGELRQKAAEQVKGKVSSGSRQCKEHEDKAANCKRIQ